MNTYVDKGVTDAWCSGNMPPEWGTVCKGETSYVRVHCGVHREHLRPHGVRSPAMPAPTTAGEPSADSNPSLLDRTV